MSRFHSLASRFLTHSTARAGTCRRGPLGCEQVVSRSGKGLLLAVGRGAAMMCRRALERQLYAEMLPGGSPATVGPSALPGEKRKIA